MSDDKKIIADDDWKEQARKEKEKIKEKEQASAKPEGQQGNRPLPPASFDELVNMFALQAVMYLGKMTPPGQEKPLIDLPVAKHHIDMLEVIQEKTKGNLSPEEEGGLKATIEQMHWLFVDVAKQAGEKK